MREILAEPSSSATEQSRTFTRAQVGMDTPRVTVETHLPGGLPGFTLVGLPETAVREAKDRVKSAIQNCNLNFPVGKVVVNLAPADLAKQGARLDLAIAVSVLSATGQIPHENIGQFEFLGELSLAGELRPIRGCLCAALALTNEPGQRRRLVVPWANARELTMAPADSVAALRHLNDVIRLLRNPQSYRFEVPPSIERVDKPEAVDSLNDVIGQHGAKRALVVAAAGGHHLLMVGPPGTGKTMLARRLARLLPRLGNEEARAVAAVYSAAGLTPDDPYRPPFRDPHHSASAPAIVGGGSNPHPGEISLAHHGVLFLDELPHFKPSVLNLLREPLETREVNIARATSRARFPAGFQLLAAMNPCPVGRVCNERSCRCSPDQVRRYRGRISGPLLDRIDLHVTVPQIPKQLLLEGETVPELAEADAMANVAHARSQQIERQGKLNTDLSPRDLAQSPPLDAASLSLLSIASDRFQLSARGYHRVLKVARTVADLEQSAEIGAPHIAESLSYRAMDWYQV